MTTERSQDDIERLVADRAAAFEKGWTERAVATERSRDQRTRRTNLQFWFLFAFLLVSFVLLAYRTEVTAQNLRVGLYSACEARVNQAHQYNAGRESLIQSVIHNPERPVPPEQQEQVIKQLRDGLLLPTEDCGPNPDA